MGWLEEGGTMPTTRRRTPRGRMSSAGITEADFLYFTWGPFFEAEGYTDNKTEEELKAFWKEHRGPIMARYLEEIKLKGPGWHGCRPWPFFKWDVSEKRLPVPEEMRFGPNGLYDYRVSNPDGMEGNYAFLKRLNLLENWEK
jgi:hypothetical protein